MRPAVRFSVGLNVAVLVALFSVTVPAIGFAPWTSVNVVMLIVVMFIALLNVAVGLTLSEMLVAPDSGVVVITVGRAALLAAVNVQT